jgi:hypothetical protein
VVEVTYLFSPMLLFANSLAGPLCHRLVGVSGLAVVLLAGCASPPGSLDPSPGDIGVSGGGDAFFIARTASGVGVEAVARPGVLSITFEGPFPSGWPIHPFGTERSADSTRRLLAASGNFVEPLEVMLLTEESRGEVLVRFAFLGEADPDRTICTTVTLKDEAGKALKIRTRHHTDKRRSEDEVSSTGDIDIRSSLEESNSDRVTVVRSVVEEIRQIVVTFEEFR